MEVRLLGPLELADGGRSIAYGGARQRAVLALLVLHANQVVASERVLMELWGEDAPPGAANALQAAVSRLRRALPQGRLVTRPPGYLFRAVPDEVDLSRFERLLAQGRQALADGAAAEAADTLADALALWRGPALADFRYEPFAQAEIARLEELRLVCVEERVEADLALGAGAELVGELQRLVAEQPLRERLRGQLMLALYRAGRQADALEAYREVRELLLEELGLEPAPALGELEGAILRHDPALRTAPAPPVAAAVPARKPVTVLCAELEVASGAGTALDPEALRNVLERAQAILGATLERHGGRLSAVAGRRIVGVFGVPTLHEDDALRAAQAALAAKGALEAEAAALEERGLTLATRVGLATGEALVGGPEPAGFAGDAVGQAEELAQRAAPGEILVGDQTRRLAAAALEVEPAGGGRFRLLAAPIGARPLPVRLDAPMVDRVEELARLRDGLARAVRDGQPVLATAFGEAGIGKSRLVHELTAQAAAEATVLTGRCLPYGDGITFWPLRELVAQAGAPEGTRQELEALLDGEADAARVAEWLAGALGPGERDGPGTLAAPEIFWATRRLLETLARRRPLVVVLEDLHWAEPTFLDLAEAVATQARQGLLLVCLARPELLERRPAWAAGAAGAIRVELGPLAEGDAGALLGALAGAPPEASRRLLEVAAGNPLFLEQLAASLGEQHWGEDEPQLPATIQALLAARLELLGPGERAVLWRAAVIGRDFTREAVAELLPAEGRGPLGRHLRALATKGLVEAPPPDPGAPGRFHFHHLLVQQAAYRAIPKSHRAELHQRFAGWSDGQGAEDEIVGYHLEQAVRYRRELGPVDDEVRALARRGAGHLEAAGTRAHARGDVPAAVRLLQRAASLLPAGDPARARAQTGLGAALMEAGRLDQAGRALAEAEEDRRGRRRPAAGRPGPGPAAAAGPAGRHGRRRRRGRPGPARPPGDLRAGRRRGRPLPGLAAAGGRALAAGRLGRRRGRLAPGGRPRPPGRRRAAAHRGARLAGLGRPVGPGPGARGHRPLRAVPGGGRQPPDRRGGDPQPPGRPVRHAGPGRRGAGAAGQGHGRLRGAGRDHDLVGHPPGQLRGHAGRGRGHRRGATCAATTRGWRRWARRATWPPPRPSWPRRSPPRAAWRRPSASSRSAGRRPARTTSRPRWSGRASRPGSWPPAGSSGRPRSWPARRSPWPPGPTSSTSTATPCSSWRWCSTGPAGRAEARAAVDPGPRSLRAQGQPGRRRRRPPAPGAAHLRLSEVSGWPGLARCASGARGRRTGRRPRPARRGCRAR